ncbi:hypothetical protein NL532_10170 [Mesorhizobium sp. C120A]|uniref:hypothetical protein n=1 Tax=unclassified Mesorhizobium TaxID=325217 RepID=UPI0003CFEAAA|nr:MULTISPECIES: hypothetical protein [unclassified Mesorhizobium]ESZ66635.1 hypothetical protein X728_04035 [Mesorhizobium sp. L103C120A0]WJI46960.1 hypothetical protein NL532_10170 [Mesorhizobium sp. C120A]
MKNPSKGKLALPRMLQIKMAAHPDIVENIASIASAMGLTSSVEVVKVALHLAVRQISLNPLDRKPQAMTTRVAQNGRS